MPGPGTQATCSEVHTPASPDAQPADSLARRLTIPGRADQVPRARAFIAMAMGALGLKDRTACLLGSELVTNSVQHSDSGQPGGTIAVTVTAGPRQVLVEVTDRGGPCLPVLRDGADPCAESGRGLLLVAALSSNWGYERGHGELTTWFQVPAEDA